MTGALDAITGVSTISVTGTIGALDAVVLAGGTARRLGGVSKPDVLVAGRRLLDHVLEGLAALRGSAALPAGRTVVVAPPEVALPPGVLRALEDPPLGGPVAGIAAGLQALAAGRGQEETGGGAPAPVTAVLTCDAPGAAAALPPLLRALNGVPTAPGVDGACAWAGDHTQYLLGVYWTPALLEAVAPGGSPLRDRAVHRTLGALRVLEVAGTERAAVDLDTWEQVRAWKG
ncbi:molybdenum cofactor guanylyltransferase [Actinomyces timonensis]|uniref:molybdenum cofactor guanylyltransferase n=1 Tax=Actinomyces timonensis TaxID=1288391 RepID=UPI0003157D7C|nr:NTP transferase domain-containing protein [Actinomyces timonensis]